MRILLASLAMVTALDGQVFAQPTWTATCEVPVGNRYDQVNGKIKESHDDFTDVHPLFVLDDEKPGKLLLIWGATKRARELGRQTKAEEATVVSRSSEKITAILIDSSAPALVEMFSLYPSKGLVFYTKHGNPSIAGVGPFTATFHAQCKFSR